MGIALSRSREIMYQLLDILAEIFDVTSVSCALNLWERDGHSGEITRHLL